MLELYFNDLKQLKDVRFEHCEALFAANVLLGPINTDSRRIRQGEIFWALKGDRFDGHSFVKTAAEKGAVFALVEHSVKTTPDFPLVIVPDSLQALQQLAKIKRQRFAHPVIGLTGSNGKTTAKEMIAHLLSLKWQVLKTEGNLNNHIGCPLTLLSLKPGHQVAVVEMGSNHPGEIAALAEITRPDWALITNIGPAHLEFFKTLEQVAREKLALFDALGQGKMIFVNADDPYLNAYQRTGLRRITFGFGTPADIRGKILSVKKDGTCIFSLNDKIDIHLNVPGVHNAYNALAAASVALFSGLSKQQIKEGLESYSAMDKRMQTLEINGMQVMNDAYNANPKSMEAAFETLSGLQHKKVLFLVLGDMLELGEQSAELHEQALQKALELNPEKVFVLGEWFGQAAQSLGDGRVLAFNTQEALIKELKKRLSPDALLFIKGSRGMQMEKILDYL